MKNILFFLIVLFFTSCGLKSAFKIRDAFLMEHIGVNDFKHELPFEIKKGALIVKVELGGKERKFILDTGSTTKINHQLKNEIASERLGKLKTFDSNGQKRHVDYVKLEKIQVEGVSFYSIVASVSDTEILKNRICEDVEGILGANVMNKAIWQIDFDRQKIIITDKRDSLNLSGNEQKIGFYFVGKGVPMFNLNIPGIYQGDVALDTGCNGTIALGINHFSSDLKCVERESYSVGTFSSKKYKIKTTRASQIKMGKAFEEKDVFVDFAKDNPLGLVGIKFLQNYLVTIDWRNNEILLGERTEYSKKQNLSFGFSLIVVDGKTRIGSIVIDSPAYKKGLRLDDEVLKINDLDFRSNQQENYCRYIHTFQTNETVKVKIQIQQEDSIVEYEIGKTNLAKIFFE